MKGVKDFDVKNKRVLVRCDFNVPLEEDGTISDDFRIKESLPTIQYLLSQNAKIILMSHLGNPEGEIVESLRMDKVKNRLEELLDEKITKADDCVGEEVRDQALHLKSGEILLLENLRFHKEETENNQEFAKELSKLADVYINDAFGVCHREHASIVGVPKFMLNGAGLLLQKEVAVLKKFLEKPARPMIAIMGGKKVETKAKFIENILKIADTVLIGGLIKKELVEKHSDILENVRVLGPTGDLEAPDINEESIKLFTEKIMQAKTIFWNGPFGKFEEEQYKKGTLAIANAIIESGAFSLVGGGETVEFLRKEGILDKFSHVSPEGGAMLEFLSGQELPGLVAIDKSSQGMIYSS